MSFWDFIFVVGIDEYDDGDDGGGDETNIAVTAITVDNNSHIKIILCVSSISLILLLFYQLNTRGAISRAHEKVHVTRIILAAITAPRHVFANVFGTRAPAMGLTVF